MHYDKLKNQKKIISKEMKMNIVLLICGLFFFILFFAAGFGGITGDECQARYEYKGEPLRHFTAENTKGNIVEIGEKTLFW